jgi:hypothetical protein
LAVVVMLERLVTGMLLLVIGLQSVVEELTLRQVQVLLLVVVALWELEILLLAT